MKGKDIWRYDRVRVIRGEYIGREGVVVSRKPGKGLAMKIQVTLDSDKGTVRSNTFTFLVSDVELIAACADHARKIIQVVHGKDDR